MNCSLCDGDKFSIEYQGQIRTGSFGKVSPDEHKVLRCDNCGLVALDYEDDPEFYESEQYRSAYNESISVADYQARHDAFETGKVARIGLEIVRDKVIADYGCGAGAFLDAVYGVAAQTIAVEPAQIFHSHLKRRHQTVSYGRDLVDTGCSIDIATSFDVVEHVDDFMGYLSDIYQSLSETGSLFLMTPNYGDVLNSVAPSQFAPFNFRSAHKYYFDASTMTMALQKVGFSEVKIDYFHKFDLSNLINWVAEGRPTGLGSFPVFNDEVNRYFSSYLEKNGLASHLWVLAKK